MCVVLLKTSTSIVCQSCIVREECLIRWVCPRVVIFMSFDKRFCPHRVKFDKKIQKNVISSPLPNPSPQGHNIDRCIKLGTVCPMKAFCLEALQVQSDYSIQCMYMYRTCIILKSCVSISICNSSENLTY